MIQEVDTRVGIIYIITHIVGAVGGRECTSVRGQT